MTSSTHLPPPSLPGLAHFGVLAGGEESSVHLYADEAGQQVAVKVFRATIDAARFAAESERLVAASRALGLVPIQSAGVTSDGHPFLTMDYYPGANLAKRSRFEPLSVADAVALGAVVAGGVEALHRAGVVHGGVRPATVLTGQNDAVGLAGYALPGLIGSWSMSRGGEPWAATEVLDGSEPTVAADVYGVAAVVAHALAGRGPFDRAGESNEAQAVARRVRARQPLRLAGDVPAEVIAVLQAALDPDPARRPPSAADLAAALTAAASGEGSSVPADELTSATTPVVARVTAEAEAPDAGRTVRRVARNSGTAAVAGPASGSGAPASAAERSSPDIVDVDDLLARAVVIDPDGGRVEADDATSRRVAIVGSAGTASATDPSTPADGGGSAPPEPPSGAGSPDGGSGGGRRRRPMAIAAVAVVAVLALGGVAAAAVASQGTDQPTEEPGPTSVASSSPPSTSESPSPAATTPPPSLAPTPTASPSLAPAAEPSSSQSTSVKPTPKPSVKPTPKPSVKPTPKPSVKPTPKPSAKPKPTSKPKPKPKPSRTDAFGDSGVDL